MQLASAQLAAHLQKGLKPLYTIHGDEPLLAQEAADAIRAAARAQGHTERSSYTVAGAHFDWSAVLAAGGSLSLFADKQMVEIRIPSGKPGKDGSVALQQIAEGAASNEGTLTLVMLPRLDKATRTGAWFSALENHGASIQVDPIERAALPQWIAQRLALQGQRVKPGDEGQRTLQFFADRVEGNLLAAHQEIQKLALLYPAGELAFEQVEAAVLNVARYDVFKLGEAVLAGQVARALRMLEGLRAGGEVAVLELAPLTPAQLEEFVASLALPGIDAAARAAVLFRQTGGNPLFALEVIKGWLTQDAPAAGSLLGHQHRRGAVRWRAGPRGALDRRGADAVLRVELARARRGRGLPQPVLGGALGCIGGSWRCIGGSSAQP